MALPFDSRPLTDDQLLPEDIRVLQEMQARFEDVLNEVKACKDKGDTASSRYEKDDLWCRPETNRTPRIFLIDGQRGTGKTSILLTLLDWWAKESCGKSSSRWVKEEVAKGCRALPILDFDPMPPSFPLLAWIVQSFRDVVLRLSAREVWSEEPTGRSRDKEPADSLEDRWNRLHDEALSAWGSSANPSAEKDRKRVQDWSRFSKRWVEFLDALFVCMKKNRGTECVQVLVMPIDDVDMQVRRAPELVRALRNLYHPRLVFLLTGNRPLLRETLQSEYNGQKLGLVGESDEKVWVKEPNSEIEVLGEKLVEKVFREGLCFEMKPLDLERLLKFNQGRMFVEDNFASNPQGTSVSKLDEPPAEWRSAASDGLANRAVRLTYRQAADLQSRVQGKQKAEERRKEILAELTRAFLRRTLRDDSLADKPAVREGNLIAYLEAEGWTLKLRPSGRVAWRVSSDGNSLVTPKTLEVSLNDDRVEQSHRPILALWWAVDPASMADLPRDTPPALVVVRSKGGERAWPNPRIDAFDSISSFLARHADWSAHAPADAEALVARWLWFTVGEPTLAPSPPMKLTALSPTLALAVEKNRAKLLSAWAPLLHAQFGLSEVLRHKLLGFLLNEMLPPVVSITDLQSWRCPPSLWMPDAIACLDTQLEGLPSTTGTQLVGHKAIETIPVGSWRFDVATDPWCVMAFLTSRGVGAWAAPFLLEGDAKETRGGGGGPPVTVRWDEVPGKAGSGDSLLAILFALRGHWAVALSVDNPPIAALTDVGVWILAERRTEALGALWRRVQLQKARRGEVTAMEWLALTWDWLASELNWKGQDLAPWFQATGQGDRLGAFMLNGYEVRPWRSPTDTVAQGWELVDLLESTGAPGSLVHHAARIFGAWTGLCDAVRGRMGFEVSGLLLDRQIMGAGSGWFRAEALETLDWIIVEKIRLALVDSYGLETVAGPDAHPRALVRLLVTGLFELSRQGDGPANRPAFSRRLSPDVPLLEKIHREVGLRSDERALAARAWFSMAWERLDTSILSKDAQVQIGRLYGDTILLRMAWPIGTRFPTVDEAEVRAFAKGRFVVNAESVEVVAVTSPTARGASIRQALSEVQALRAGRATKLLIAAIGPLADLVTLGWHIGDAQDAFPLLKLREEPWGWQPSKPDEQGLRMITRQRFVFTEGLPRSTKKGGPKGTERIGILINLSGENSLADLPYYEGGYWVREIRVDKPSPVAIQSERQREQFLKLLKEAYAWAATQPAAKERGVHVFAAANNALAVDIGRVYLPQGYPALHVWTKVGDSWEPEPLTLRP